MHIFSLYYIFHSIATIKKGVTLYSLKDFIKSTKIAGKIHD